MKHISLFKYGLTVLFFLCATLTFAQNAPFTGKVVDENNQPLPGAVVRVKGTETATSTDVSGAFRINSGQQAIVITVSFVGYDVAEKSLVANQPLTIQMQPNSKSLSEVVVVGYGTSKKSDLTGAVSNLGTKDLNPGPITNPLQQLAGKAAGVNVTQTGSEPGTAPSVRIRGTTSLIGGNDPLVVVDGVQGNMDLLQASPPSEIESVDVLKDASATAIYGSRGAPGVIIVTTKKNKATANLRVEYSTSVSVDVIGKKLKLA
jgi:TonB-dependent SusC/RagA subfamily outer membrane receptor